jgi:hypothetical protein
MKTRQFHLGDILSVSHDRLVSLSLMDGLCKILNFMTGDELFTHQLPRASRECRPHLKRQLPFLDSPEIDFAEAELGELLNTPSGKRDPENVVKGWLVKMVAKYGEMHPVEPIPTADHERRNPLTELAEMVGPERVIAVVVPEQKRRRRSHDR